MKNITSMVMLSAIITTGCLEPSEKSQEESIIDLSQVEGGLTDRQSGTTHHDLEPSNSLAVDIILPIEIKEYLGNIRDTVVFIQASGFSLHGPGGEIARYADGSWTIEQPRPKVGKVFYDFGGPLISVSEDQIMVSMKQENVATVDFGLMDGYMVGRYPGFMALEVQGTFYLFEEVDGVLDSFELGGLPGSLTQLLQCEIGCLYYGFDGQDFYSLKDFDSQWEKVSLDIPLSPGIVSVDFREGEALRYAVLYEDRVVFQQSSEPQEDGTSEILDMDDQAQAEDVSPDELFLSVAESYCVDCHAESADLSWWENSKEDIWSSVDSMAMPPPGRKPLDKDLRNELLDFLAK